MDLKPCCSHSIDSRQEQVVAATVLTLCSRLVDDIEDSQRSSFVIVAAGRIRDLQIQDRLERQYNRGSAQDAPCTSVLSLRFHRRVIRWQRLRSPELAKNRSSVIARRLAAWNRQILRDVRQGALGFGSAETSTHSIPMKRQKLIVFVCCGAVL